MHSSQRRRRQLAQLGRHRPGRVHRSANEQYVHLPGGPVSSPACTVPLNSANVERSFRSRHVGGVQFTLADGSVRFISQNLNHPTYQALGGRADDVVIGEF